MTYSGHGDAVFGVGFSGDGKLVFSAGADKKIHAWNPEDGAKKGEIGGFGREVLALATHGDKIFSGSADKNVQQHRVEGFKHFKTYAGSADAVFCVAYHPGTGPRGRGQLSPAKCASGMPRTAAQVSDFLAAPGYSPPVAAEVGSLVVAAIGGLALAAYQSPTLPSA